MSRPTTCGPIRASRRLHGAPDRRRRRRLQSRAGGQVVATASRWRPCPARRREGYLAPEARPDLTKILAPPPGRRLAPRRRRRRDLRPDPRPEGHAPLGLATADVDGSVYDHFAQALGVRLTPQRAPILTALLERAGEDRSVVGLAKTYWGTQAALYRQGRRADLRGQERSPGRQSRLSVGPLRPAMHVAMILAELAPSAAPTPCMREAASMPKAAMSAARTPSARPKRACRPAR
jgi:hypothetical protein